MDEEGAADLTSVDCYDSNKAKLSASLHWLITKAYHGEEMPEDLRQPFYQDQEGGEHVRPVAINLLASGELYSRVAAHVYPNTTHQWKGHWSVIQALSRKGIYVLDRHDAAVTESVLVQTAPFKVDAHVAMMDALMTAHTAEVVSIEKVVQAVRRFATVTASSELPYDLEDALLFWINKVCVTVKYRLEKSQHPQKVKGEDIMVMDDLLKDISDSSCLAVLFHFYCPQHLHLEDIALEQPISMANSIFNLQLLRKLCMEKMPGVFQLTYEDVLYSHLNLKQNVLVFLAELFHWFESVQPSWVTPLEGTKAARTVNPGHRPSSETAPAKHTTLPQSLISNVTKKSFHGSISLSDENRASSHPELHRIANPSCVATSPGLLPLLPKRHLNSSHGSHGDHHAIGRHSRRGGGGAGGPPGPLRRVSSLENVGNLRQSKLAWPPHSPSDVSEDSFQRKAAEKGQQGQAEGVKSILESSSVSSSQASSNLLAQVSMDSNMAVEEVEASDQEIDGLMASEGAAPQDPLVPPKSPRKVSRLNTETFRVAPSAVRELHPQHKRAQLKQQLKLNTAAREVAGVKGRKSGGLMPAAPRPRKEKWQQQGTKREESGESAPPRPARHEDEVSEGTTCDLDSIVSPSVESIPDSINVDLSRGDPSPSPATATFRTFAAAPRSLARPPSPNPHVKTRHGEAFFVGASSSGESSAGSQVAGSYTINERVYTPQAAMAAGIPIVQQQQGQGSPEVKGCDPRVDAGNRAAEENEGKEAAGKSAATLKLALNAAGVPAPSSPVGGDRESPKIHRDLVTAETSKDFSVAGTSGGSSSPRQPNAFYLSSLHGVHLLSEHAAAKEQQQHTHLRSDLSSVLRSEHADNKQHQQQQHQQLQPNHLLSDLSFEHERRQPESNDNFLSEHAYQEEQHQPVPNDLQPSDFSSEHAVLNVAVTAATAPPTARGSAAGEGAVDYGEGATTDEGSSTNHMTNWAASSKNADFVDAGGADRAGGGALANSELMQIRLKLDEKRRAIEAEKKQLTKQRYKQRQRIGKAAFMQVLARPASEATVTTVAIQQQQVTTIRPASQPAAGQQSGGDLPVATPSPQGSGLPPPHSSQPGLNSQEAGALAGGSNGDDQQYNASLEKLNLDLTYLQREVQRLTQAQEHLKAIQGSSPPRSSPPQPAQEGQGGPPPDPVAPAHHPPAQLTTWGSQSLSSPRRNATPVGPIVPQRNQGSGSAVFAPGSATSQPSPRGVQVFQQQQQPNHSPGSVEILQQQPNHSPRSFEILQQQPNLSPRSFEILQQQPNHSPRSDEIHQQQQQPNHSPRSDEIHQQQQQPQQPQQGSLEHQPFILHPKVPQEAQSDPHPAPHPQFTPPPPTATPQALMQDFGTPVGGNSLQQPSQQGPKEGRLSSTPLKPDVTQRPLQLLPDASPILRNGGGQLQQQQQQEPFILHPPEEDSSGGGSGILKIEDLTGGSDLQVEDNGMITGFIIEDQLEKSEDDITKKKRQFLQSRLKRQEEERIKREKRELEAEKKREAERKKKEEADQKKALEKARKEQIREEWKKKKQEQEMGLDHHQDSKDVAVVSKRSTAKVRPKSRVINHDEAPHEGASSTKPRPGSRVINAEDVPDSSHVVAFTSRSDSSSSPLSQDVNATEHLNPFSEYTGPKLYKKLTTKSNRRLMTNAMTDCILAGVANKDVKEKVLQAIVTSEAKNFLVLFRDARCQFRGLYDYQQEPEEITKIYGTGPRHVSSEMIEKLFKYNSGSKQFTPIPSKTLSVSVDAFIIHSHLWQTKKVAIPSKLQKQ